MHIISLKLTRGFSLLELVICLTIIGILFHFASPYIYNILYNQEVNSILPIIKQHFMQGKANALTHHSEVVMCSTKNFNECQEDNWSSGIILFIDNNHNRQVDFNEKIISTTKTSLKYGKLEWRGNASHKHEIVFKGDTGLPRGVKASFYYCGIQSPKSMQVIVYDFSQPRAVNLQQC